MSRHYLWERGLSLDSFLGNATLGDPDADNVLWCTNFREWRDIHQVPAHAAVFVLQSHLSDTTYWEVDKLDSEWMMRGRSEPQTAQDWEDFLAFSLEFISARARRGLAPRWETWNNRCENFVKGNQSTTHPRTTMARERKPRLAHSGEACELEDTPRVYPWKNELTLTKLLGNATLGDPDTDHVLWCTNFRKWRAIHKVPVRAAVCVLQSRLLDLTNWDEDKNVTECMMLGRSEPQTAQECEEFLNFSLEFVSKACWGRPIRETSHSDFEKLLQGTQDSIHRQTLTGRTLKPRCPQGGEPKNMSPVYTWKNELTLTKMLGNATLDDPDTEPALWCVTFSNWRNIHSVPAYAAVIVLQSRLPGTTYWQADNIDTEWIQLGRSKPQTEQDWEDFLAFSLKFVSAQACRGHAPTRETLNYESENLVQANQLTTHTQTPMERKLMPPLPQIRQVGEPEDTSGGYSWKNELTLSKLLGNATLGDPDTDRVHWCANFRKWRDIHKVPAHAAVVVLQSHFLDTTYWEIGNIDAEWIHLGKCEPQTTQDWEEFLAVSLKLVSAQARSGRAPTWGALKKEYANLLQANQDTTDPQTQLELNIKFPPLFQPGHKGEPEDVSGGYSWKSELTLTKILGNATLDSQDVDHLLWCANFRKWRAIKAVPAHAAVAMLQSLVPNTALWQLEKGNFKAEWMLRGRSEPQTAQDWEEFLAFSLDFVSAIPRWDLAAARWTMNIEWENLVQGNKSVRQFANCILKLANKYKRINPSAPKSIYDIFDKFMAGANPSSHMFVQIAHLFKEVSEEQSPTKATYAFCSFVRIAIAHEGIVATEANNAA